MTPTTGETPVCPLCELGIDHAHHNNYPPVVPCHPCFIGVHEVCDPANYWCTCDCGLKGDSR